VHTVISHHKPTSHSLLAGVGAAGAAGRGGGGLEATIAAAERAAVAVLVPLLAVGGWERSTRKAFRTPPGVRVCVCVCVSVCAFMVCYG